MDVIQRLDLLLLCIVIVHLSVCPFTKVEESFNLQAVHDILYHRENVSRYDHHAFPGVVPRTFIGPLTLSVVASPFIFLAHRFHASKFYSLLLVRSVLGAFILGSLKLFRMSVNKRFGREVATWTTILCLSQFHLLFYASRTLPNVFGLCLAILALHYWLDDDLKKFTLASGAGIIWFRSELALLLGFYLMSSLLEHRISIGRLLKICVPAFLVLTTCTVMVDSFFWRRFVWPEGEVFWFNTVLNRSADWGTSPFLWYFYSALPRAMGASFFFIPFCLFEKDIRRFVLPALFFVLGFSFLPHKELRFIIYVLPILNVGVASVCAREWKSLKRFQTKWIGLMCYGHVFLNLALNVFLLFVSSQNYPGGIAIQRLHELVKPDKPYNIYIGNLAAQSGVSRFLETNVLWRYDKTENLSAAEMKKFSFLLLESKDWEQLADVEGFSLVDVVSCFSEVHFSYSSFPPAVIRTSPCIFIIEYRDPDQCIDALA
ncbi:unnamed protein product [Notodromas monacha]|uniref:Mannosyltransferase n=1 Tax=Notodromas monacha TaxID=399045 RepID=A0A7R9BF68_9CRUS|nr:unnamed protein product [Notodromas monacha]CAG0913377.1 unnamed protein product [Notodromas monacha]